MLKVSICLIVSNEAKIKLDYLSHHTKGYSGSSMPSQQFFGYLNILMNIQNDYD